MGALGRREFLHALTAAGTATLLPAYRAQAAAEPPPEIRKLRLLRTGSICWAPQYMAEELLRDEEFTQIQYAEIFASDAIAKALASDQADISMQFVAPDIIRIDAGDPILLLAGVHVGCLDLRGTEDVRTIRDLKGKLVAVSGSGGVEHLFISSMAAYVGLDPTRDIRWITHPPAASMRLLADGLIDAVLVVPPLAQEMAAMKIGRSIIDTAKDRPWSGYFCCVVAGRQEFVRKYPIATRRALRAILKAADICASEPERVAQSLVDKNYTNQHEYALRAMKDVQYGKWRAYNPEDTIRFYALRLHEAGLIKSSPQKILAQGTDWRFLNELKKELKG